MPAIDHTFKVCQRCFSQGAEIDVNNHEYRKDKPESNMKQVGNVYSA